MKKTTKFNSKHLDFKEACRSRLIDKEIKFQNDTWKKLHNLDINDQNYNAMSQVYADRIKASIDRLFALELSHYMAMNINNYHI